MNDRPLRDTTWVFEVSDSGLVLSSEQRDTRLHVLPAGDVSLGSSRVTPPNGGIGDSTSYLRTVTLDEQLVYYTDTLDGLLCVKFEDAWIDNDSTRLFSYYEWKFYFARDHGIIAVKALNQWTYLPAKFDSLPLPLTGWSWDEGGLIDSPHGSTPFPLSEGCWWTYVRTLNGLPQDTVRVEVVGIDSLPDNTPVSNISRSFVTSYAHVTDDAIDWYSDLTDNEPECTWQLPFEAGNELGDRGLSRGLSFRRVITREDSPGTYSTFKNCWKLEVDIILEQTVNQLWVVDTLHGYAWLAEGVGLVELTVDGYRTPRYEQVASLGYVLIDYEVTQ
jgi:hypothetical protein